MHVLFYSIIIISNRACTPYTVLCGAVLCCAVRCCAVRCSEYRLRCFDPTGRSNVIDLLIAAEADLNSRSKSGTTPLWEAVPCLYRAAFGASVRVRAWYTLTRIQHICVHCMSYIPSAFSHYLTLRYLMTFFSLGGRWLL